MLSSSQGVEEGMGAGMGMHGGQDKPSILASALLRLIESGNSGNSTTQMEMAVLRSLDSTPEVRAEMPLWGSAAAKRVWQAGRSSVRPKLPFTQPPKASQSLRGVSKASWHSGCRL